MAIARALRDRPGLAALVSRPAGAPRPEDCRWSFVACDPDATSEAVVPPADAGGAPGWGGAPAAPGWIGVLPYDALRAGERPRWSRVPDDRPAPLHARPAWRRYPAVVRVDHAEGTVCVEATTPADAARLARLLARPAAPHA